MKFEKLSLITQTFMKKSWQEVPWRCRYCSLQGFLKGGRWFQNDLWLVNWNDICNLTMLNLRYPSNMGWKYHPPLKPEICLTDRGGVDGVGISITWDAFVGTLNSWKVRVRFLASPLWFIWEIYSLAFLNLTNRNRKSRGYCSYPKML